MFVYLFLINVASFYVQNISEEKFIQLFEALEGNTHLEALSLTNVGLTDRTAMRLADAMEKNSTLRVLKYVNNHLSITTNPVFREYL